jgi:hypothetical protein
MITSSCVDARKVLGFSLRRQGKLGFGRNHRGAKKANVFVVLVREEN